MIKCPDCGSDNPDEATFCRTCGENLSAIKPKEETKSDNQEVAKYCVKCGYGIKDKSTEICPKCGAKQTFKSTKYCGNCGAEIDINAEICHKCGVRVMYRPTSNKSTILAAVLSFFIPGLGQIYDGKVGRGISFFIVICILYALYFLIFPLIIGFLLWIYCIYDAYRIAKNINLGIE